MATSSRRIGKSCAYNLNYHVVWCPKRRAPVLIGNIQNDLKDILKETCNSLGIQIQALEVMPDHVHLFVSCGPKISPHVLVKKMKGASSNFLRKKYPSLLKLPALWSSSYYAGTVGTASETVVKMYIENQKGK